MDQTQQPASRIPHLASRLPIPRKSTTEPVKRNELLSSFKRPSKLAQKQPFEQNVETVRNATLTGHGGKDPRPYTKTTELEIIQYPTTPEEVVDSRSVATSDLESPILSSALSKEESDRKSGSSSVDPGDPPQTPREKRKPRPSLSDRTVTTLSQIPPSPSSNRRRSSFFNNDIMSPMGPPPRPSSAINMARSRPDSPSKQPPIPTLPKELGANFHSRSVPGRRSITQPASPTPGKMTANSRNHGQTPASLASASTRDGGLRATAAPRRQLDSSRKLLSSHTVAYKSSLGRQCATVKPPNMKLTSDKTSSVVASKKLSAVPSPSRQSSTQPLYCSSSKTDSKSVASSKPPPTSSKSLRDAIAKAKREVAKRSSPTQQEYQKDAISSGAGTLLDSASGNIDGEAIGTPLLGRIRTGLQSGSLNVGALGLKTLPREVKQMYEMAQELGISWFECVDLTRFIAAGNELEMLESDLFPDVADEELKERGEDVYVSSLFRGLEVLGLQNNELKDITPGVGRLSKLRILDLSGNRLHMSSLLNIFRIGGSLTELRMSGNHLSGLLDDGVKDLQNLEILELHANKITQLPDCLHELPHLKVLNVSQNQLSSIPALLLSNGSLLELNASSNQLTGALFPPHVRLMPTLKRLDASRNMLEALTTVDLALPSLQSLDLGGNRLRSVCDMSVCAELLTLALGGNSINEIPTGFSSLSKLRNADLSSNNIRRLDDSIGFMDALASINLSGNPVRERKYLTMSAEELKLDLQRRRVQSQEMENERETIEISRVRSTR